MGFLWTLCSTVQTYHWLLINLIYDIEKIDQARIDQICCGDNKII